MKSAVTRAARTCALLGIAVGAVMMYIAWDHNPQCEIQCVHEGVHWGYWLLLGASWFILTFASTFVPLVVFRWLSHLVRSRLRSRA